MWLSAIRIQALCSLLLRSSKSVFVHDIYAQLRTMHAELEKLDKLLGEDSQPAYFPNFYSSSKILFAENECGTTS